MGNFFFGGGEGCLQSLTAVEDGGLDVILNLNNWPKSPLTADAYMFNKDWTKLM